VKRKLAEPMCFCTNRTVLVPRESTVPFGGDSFYARQQICMNVFYSETGAFLNPDFLSRLKFQLGLRTRVVQFPSKQPNVAHVCAAWENVDRMFDADL
jgi:hypothetical protein